MDPSGQAVAWISAPSDSADAAEVQLGVRTAARTWTIPGACGGSAADSLAVATPTDDESPPAVALSGPGGVCVMRPDATPSVLEPSPGEVPRAVALGEDAARLVVGMDVNGVGLLSAYDSGEYLGLALPGAARHGGSHRCRAEATCGRRRRAGQHRRVRCRQQRERL